jgi:hypothetical protein
MRGVCGAVWLYVRPVAGSSASPRLLGPHRGVTTLLGVITWARSTRSDASVITRINGAAPAILRVGHLGVGVSR